MDSNFLKGKSFQTRELTTGHAGASWVNIAKHTIDSQRDSEMKNFACVQFVLYNEALIHGISPTKLTICSKRRSLHGDL